VYAVDASPGAAALAAKVVSANPDVGSTIEVLCARGEVVELPVPQVEVIMADWMGHMILHNSMIPVMGRVRDRWVGGGGLEVGALGRPREQLFWQQDWKYHEYWAGI
jgi:protein arginine N-methyltransferase 1